MNLILIISAFIIFCYCLTILISCIGFSKLQKANPTNVNLEKEISIIIPFRNEEENILKCLFSLTSQLYNKENYEIILVNDHSTDNSVSIIEKYINDFHNIRLYHLKNKKSKKEALKLGVSNAKYDLIAFTDADCELPKTWLNSISKHIKDEDMLIGSVCMNASKKSFLSVFQSLDFMALQGVSFGFLNIKKPILNNAANLAIQKKSFIKVNGFDSYNTPSGDDVFLLEKFLSKGLNVKGILQKESIVNTATERTLSLFINQRLRWASKSKYYKNQWLKSSGILVFLSNVVMMFVYAALVFVENYFIILIILTLSKWLIDFILLLLVASFFNRKRDLFYFIPVQLVYPIYTVGIGLTSLFVSYNWKGRKI